MGHSYLDATSMGQLMSGDDTVYRDEVSHAHSLSFLDDNAEDTAPGTNSITNVVFSCPVDHEGTSVFVKGWLHDGDLGQPLLIIHDLGENLNLYRYAAKGLAAMGFNTFGYDLRGHGRSGRQMGHIPRFEALVNDLLQVANWIKYKSNGIAPVILANGVGALIAVYFQVRYPHLCPKSVFIDPSVGPDKKVSWFNRVLLGAMAEAAPTMRLPRALTPRFLVRFESHKSDGGKRVYHGITSNFAREVMTAIAGIGPVFSMLDKPTLILTSKSYRSMNALDQMIMDNPASANFVKVPNQNAETKLLAGDSEVVDNTVCKIVEWLV